MTRRPRPLHADQRRLWDTAARHGRIPTPAMKAGFAAALAADDDLEGLAP